MKIRERSSAKATNPNKNHSKKNSLLVLVILITVLLILWVMQLGKKAERTISVAMWAEPVYKNETITPNKVVEYKMLQAEFEKYALENKDGSKTRRIVLWDEVNDYLINNFAAYPLQANTVVMITDVASSRVDNSNTVLYSYPGKNIVALTLGEQDLSTFKTFIEPGDRVNITAIYTDREVIEGDDGSRETVETIRQEGAFKDILIADLLNRDGDSVLDLYASYNDMTVYQQAALDSDENWKDKTEPSTLLVALTPEEEKLYYKYLSKSNIEFHMSLPQRIE